MDSIITKLIESGNLIWVLALGVGLVAVLMSGVKSIVSSLARERSRREIAAYIAEGSMTPEQGERLMVAGEPKQSGCG